MVLAWSITEVLRYTFYFLTLLPSSITVSIPFTSLKFTINIQVPRILLYLRYTTFYILYPIGASSEAFVNLCTLPRSSPIPSVGSWARGAVWGPMDLGRAVLFIVWWPGELLFRLIRYFYPCSDCVAMERGVISSFFLRDCDCDCRDCGACECRRTYDCTPCWTLACICGSTCLLAVVIWFGCVYLDASIGYFDLDDYWDSYEYYAWQYYWYYFKKWPLTFPFGMLFY